MLRQQRLDFEAINDMRRLNMKLKCQKNDLIQAVATVQKAITNKSTLAILSNIKLEAYGTTLTLTGSDLNLSIITKIPVTIDEEGSFVLPSRLLGELIRKSPDEIIEMELKEDKMFIHSGLSNFNIQGQSAIDYPELPEVDNNNVYDVDAQLLSNMIRQTNFAISQDDSRIILTGSLIEINDGILNIVSLDGYRMAIRKAIIKNNENNRVVIPGKTLSEVFKILGSSDFNGDVKLSFTDKHALFSIGDNQIISRLLEGEFINYNQILPSEFKSQVKVNTKEFMNSIDRAFLMARESKNVSIKMVINDDFIEILSNTEVGSFNEKIQIKLEGQDLEIGFNPKYLIDALKIIDAEEIYLDLINGISPCIIRPADNNNFKYLVLPVRLAR